MLKSALTAVNLGVSVFIWIPSQIKIVRTKSARDYSPLTFVLILWLQFANLSIAAMDGSRSLMLYFAVNATSVLATFILIMKYRAPKA